ncbi:MAG TPA: NAD+ synthase [Phycisphaerales bacterium]|nr:NAD+ synthase [Phycisphaerales bacterium]
MRIVLATLNPTIGDIAGNTAKIIHAIDCARRNNAELIVLPELAISGYPPRDLLLYHDFIDRCIRESTKIGREHSAGITIIFGAPLRHESKPKSLTNSLLAYRDGDLLARYNKRLLPTYDVFDECRYFEPGDTPAVIEVGGKRIGLSICEDAWQGEDVGRSHRYADLPDPIAQLVDAGAEIIVNPSASPFVLGKHQRHREILAGHARRHHVPCLAVNQLGGNDELVFDGSAFAIDSLGHISDSKPAFTDDMLVVDVGSDPRPPHLHAGDETDPLLSALVLGVRDYVHKTGFSKVCLGLSGGIDSAVTAAIATIALGPDNITGVAMPGKYSSRHSVDDARELARCLGCRFLLCPIEHAFAGFRGSLNTAFDQIGQRPLGESLPDLAEENLQARVRGTTLMAISNRTGDLLLTTGNKSELAVGYCTLYGDMNGGLAVLSDVTKNLVYRLAHEINTHHARLGLNSPPIPQSTIDKPPSAELAPDQKDADTLPPYDVLDEIVRRHVEQHESAEAIVKATGFDRPTVERIVGMIARNEYKRKQIAIGLKVTSVAFGSGRRMPIARA